MDRLTISVIRHECISKGRHGKLYLPTDFGTLTFDTLENEDYIIPAGDYNVTIYNSPKFRREVLLLHGVPNRNFIEVHVGNTISDTKGCLLCGKRSYDMKLIVSRYSLDVLIHNIKLMSPSSITLSIKQSAL